MSQWGHLYFSLIASCKLHGLDPEAYLEGVIRVMPYWPNDRYIELCPKYWVSTRARLNDAEMKQPLGHITVPPPPSDPWWTQIVPPNEGLMRHL